MDISAITISGQRIRKLRPEVVVELAASMKDVGLLHPVVVDEDGRLIAGMHRIEAAKSLGWKRVPHVVVKGLNKDEAIIAEIDENLTRAELSPAEISDHLVKRKVVYLRIHPETKVGAAPSSGPGRGKKPRNQESQNGILVNPAFIDDVAMRTGKGRTTIARSVQRGEKIANLADCVGTSLDQGDELDALVKLSDEKQATLIAKAAAGEKVSAKTEVKKVIRAEKEQSLAGATKEASRVLGKKLYGVIYADPPWRFEPYSRETGMDRAADNHYETMQLDDIKAMKVPAAQDCVLFLWATVPMLPQALDVMVAWGFEYKSHCVWVKNRVGTGYWFRNQHELLLVGTRGKIPAPAQGDQYSSVIEANLAKHSSKPAHFAEMIEALFPNVPAVELFARGKRLGWDTWGNEVKG
jgi:N6-adenosine-specific RNA methylase IME4